MIISRVLFKTVLKDERDGNLYRKERHKEIYFRNAEFISLLHQ